LMLDGKGGGLRGITTFTVVMNKERVEKARLLLAK